MNSKTRLESKYLLSENTARLFLITLLSFVLRWGVVAAPVAAALFFAKSEFFSFLLSAYDNTAVYFFAAATLAVTVFLCAAVASALKLGERYIYFTRAQGNKFRVRSLFKFFAPKKAFKAFRFYVAFVFLKTLWLVYFMLPVGVCAGCTAYLCNVAYLSPEVYTVLLFGTSLLLSVSAVVWRVCVLRYCAAPLYLCIKEDISVTEAFKKSIDVCDGFLTDGVLLEYSFAGWLLSCISVFPLIYAVPYIKLTKSVFVSEIVFSQVHTAKSRYSVNYLKLSPSSEHID